ncbi:DUF4349 domain-containing protein [Aeromicrobium sp.]|uniref:DUF4349 domain-containing protein n=1 Tax=Aeromicrobium sp. TaxID=1871063 RepID=UPI0030BEBB66
MNHPTLDDDRIASMRSSVMQAVDQDINRRSRRARRTIGLAAASVLVVGAGSIGVDALSNMSTSSDDSAGTSSQSDSRLIEQPGTSSLEDSGSESADKPLAPEDDRKVITTGSISVTVKQPRVTAQQLSAYVDSIGGRVDSRTEDGTGEDASADLLIRVPSSKLTATIAQLKTYGTVETVSLRNDDVTAASKDLDARIDALELSIGRLEKLLGTASNNRSIIAAESALTKRQSQLEQLESQQRSMDGQVELSTIQVSLAQKLGVESVEPGGFKGGLTNGWNALVSTVNNVVEVAGTLLPWAAIAVLVYGAYRLVSRRRGWS